MQENRVKRLLREGKTVVGGWMCTADAMLTETVADCGPDFVVIDTEHSAQTMLTVQAHMMALKDTGATPVVRVVWNDFVRVKQVLDVGAQGIVCPWVNTVAEAEQAVSATRYPPHGIRGFGPRRAQRYGTDMKDYFDHANENIVVFCQVETQQALDNAAAIAQVDGVDALLIGPADLSVNLGIPLDWECETFLAALHLVRDAAAGAGKAFGVITVGADMARRWLGEGARVLIAGSDTGLLKTAAQTTIDEIRSAISAD